MPSDPNEEIVMTIEDPETIPYAVDSNLQTAGAAADAQAVGAAISTLQTAIAGLNAGTLYMDATQAQTIGAAITSILTALTPLSDALLKTAQTLNSTEKSQVRTNLGLGGAADYNVANSLETASSGASVLDAYQGNVLKTAIETISASLKEAAGYLVANNVTTASAGSAVLDAYQGKLLNDAITNINTLLTQINTAMALLVSTENQPDLTDSQRDRARANIKALGASDVADVVRTSSQPDLDEVAKAQARTNIGAIGTTELNNALADVVRTSQQTIGTDAQAQARANIGAVSQTDFDNRNQNLWRHVELQMADEASLASNAVATYTKLAPSVDGYTVVGVIGTSMDGSNTSFIFTRNAFINSQNEVKITCRNTGSSAATVTLYAKLLYIKN